MQITVEKAEQCVAAYRARYNRANAQRDVRGIECHGERLSMWVQLLAQAIAERDAAEGVRDNRALFNQHRADRYGVVA